MKNYLNYMVKNSKWCIVLTVACLFLFTFGLPSLKGGEVTWHPVYEIPKLFEMLGFSLLLLATVVFSWLQVYNEYSRPKRNGND